MGKGGGEVEGGLAVALKDGGEVRAVAQWFLASAVFSICFMNIISVATNSLPAPWLFIYYIFFICF